MQDVERSAATAAAGAEAGTPSASERRRSLAAVLTSILVVGVTFGIATPLLSSCRPTSAVSCIQRTWAGRHATPGGRRASVREVTFT